MPSSNNTPSQPADLQFERKNHDMVKLPKCRSTCHLSQAKNGIDIAKKNKNN